MVLVKKVQLSSPTMWIAWTNVITTIAFCLLELRCTVSHHFIAAGSCLCQSRRRLRHKDEFCKPYFWTNSLYLPALDTTQMPCLQGQVLHQLRYGNIALTASHCYKDLQLSKAPGIRSTYGKKRLPLDSPHTNLRIVLLEISLESKWLSGGGTRMWVLLS